MSLLFFLLTEVLRQLLLHRLLLLCRLLLRRLQLCRLLLRQLRLLRAVEPILLELATDPNATIENALAHLRRAGLAAPGDKIVIATDIVAEDRLVDAVQLRTLR